MTKETRKLLLGLSGFVVGLSVIMAAIAGEYRWMVLAYLWGLVLAVGILVGSLAGIYLLIRRLMGTRVVSTRMAPLIFSGRSADALATHFKEALGPSVVVRIKGDEKKIQVRIEEGAWKGASLVITSDGQQMQLAGAPGYYVPDFLAKVVVFLTLPIIASLVIIVVVWVLSGELILYVGPIGGLMGAILYSVAQDMYISMQRPSWPGRIQRALEALRG